MQGRGWVLSLYARPPHVLTYVGYDSCSARNMQLSESSCDTGPSRWPRKQLGHENVHAQSLACPYCLLMLLFRSSSITAGNYSKSQQTLRDQSVQLDKRFLSDAQETRF